MEVLFVLGVIAGVVLIVGVLVGFQKTLRQEAAELHRESEDRMDLSR